MQLYKNTPYLAQLQEQMGQTFAQSVASEVRTFDEIRAQLRESGAKERLAQLPNQLRSIGATLAGPLSLPRGETTQVPLLLRDPEGSPWLTAKIGLYTDPQGRWEALGIQGSGGDIRRVQEPKAYEPDDLSRANDDIGSALDKIGQVSRAFVQHAQQNPVGQAPMQAPAAGGAQAVGPQVPGPQVPGPQVPARAAGGAQAPAASGQSTRRSTRRSGQQSTRRSGRQSGQQSGYRRVPGSQGTAPQQTVPQKNAKMTRRRMAKFIRRQRSKGLPEWVRRIYGGKNRHTDRWEEFADEVAIPCYRKAAGQYTFPQLWQMMEQQAAQTGFFNAYPNIEDALGL
ncbi:hypothetical protein [Salinibacter ruber]|uniref:Uncharacterized protein n=1 Tax=Salinibacter ruber TaxID=146919 RepID=A0AAW5P844_9BACT|nr:hypothetical protein [Salinibacter ruber]MCS4157629.1 hypothetical protein [Salinibacter ruber]